MSVASLECMCVFVACCSFDGGERISMLHTSNANDYRCDMRGVASTMHIAGVLVSARGPSQHLKPLPFLWGKGCVHVCSRNMLLMMKHLAVCPLP